MKKILSVLFIFLSLAALFGQISISPGAKMPEVSADWIGEKPKELPIPTDDKHVLEVIVMVDVMSPDTLQAIRMVDAIAKNFESVKNPVIRYLIVAGNTKDQLQEVLKNESGLAVTIGADKNKQTFRDFAIATTPYAFVGKDNAILWSGHPVDLGYVVESAIQNKFSERQFRKLYQFRRDMQTAIRTGLPEVAAQTADKALKEFPADVLALQTRLYAFQQKGRFRDAAIFLHKHIKKYPEAGRPGIRLMLLDMIIRSNDWTLWQKSMDDAIKKVEKDPMQQLNLAAFMIERVPALRAPVKEIIKLAEQAEKGLAGKQNHADALEVLARANYMACRLDKAIQYQGKAVTLRAKQNPAQFERAQNILKFYQGLK